MSLLRTDGTYTIYRIQHKGRDGKWHGTSFDYFGTPPSFSAVNRCWQKTGVHGALSRSEAMLGLRWIRKHNRYDWSSGQMRRNTDTKFRLVMVEISQKTTPIVSTMED
jgi:hypothetical protein